MKDKEFDWQENLDAIYEAEERENEKILKAFQRSRFIQRKFQLQRLHTSTDERR